MPLSDNTKDILSLGAHGRVQTKQAEYETACHRLKAAHDELQSVAARVNRALSKLSDVRRHALTELAGIRRIAKHLNARERVLGDVQIAASAELALRRIDATLSAAELGESAITALSTGASTALGALAISAAGGQLATGAAILAGAGAAPAALTGVAASGVVIGGLALLPAVAAMAIMSHARAGSKIREIETMIANVEKQQGEIISQQTILSAAQKRIAELSAATTKGGETFAAELGFTVRRLYPFGRLSRLLKRLRRFFGGNYFSARDLEVIAPMLQIAELLAKLIDQKVVDEQGNWH